MADHVDNPDRADLCTLLSSFSVVSSSPVRFPEISVCSASPYNVTRMASTGYSNPFYYYLGKDISTGTFIGWGGRDQEDPLELLENLTTIADTVFTDWEGKNWVDGTFYAYAYTSKPYRYLPAQIQVCIYFCLHVGSFFRLRNRTILTAVASGCTSQPQKQRVRLPPWNFILPKASASSSGIA